jgi:nucleoside diphosphate kinase
MRQITIEAYNAFQNNKRFKKSNTEVIVKGDYVVMELFGNAIVKKVNGEIFISDAGWATMTTRERLNLFVRKIRKHYDSLIINEKIVLENNKWYNINQLQ